MTLKQNGLTTVPGDRVAGTYSGANGIVASEAVGTGVANYAISYAPGTLTVSEPQFQWNTGTFLTAMILTGSTDYANGKLKGPALQLVDRMLSDIHGSLKELMKGDSDGMKTLANAFVTGYTIKDVALAVKKREGDSELTGLGITLLDATNHVISTFCGKSCTPLTDAEFGWSLMFSNVYADQLKK